MVAKEEQVHRGKQHTSEGHRKEKEERRVEGIETTKNR